MVYAKPPTARARARSVTGQAKSPSHFERMQEEYVTRAVVVVYAKPPTARARARTATGEGMYNTLVPTPSGMEHFSFCQGEKPGTCKYSMSTALVGFKKCGWGSDAAIFSNGRRVVKMYDAKFH